MPDLSERKILTAITPRIDAMIRAEIQRVAGPLLKTAEGLSERVEARLSVIDARLREHLTESESMDEHEEN